MKINILILFSIVIFATSCSKNNLNNEAIKEITLRLEPDQNNPRNSEGDFIQLKDGSILFVYTHFTGGTGDHATAHLAGRYSYDQGKTWTDKDTSILTNEGGMNIMSVSLLRLQSGKIVLFYLRKNSETDCIPYMRISTDEAKTWSQATRCIDTKRYHVVNNDRLVQLAKGRIIFPTAIHAAPNWKNGKIMCYYSDDNGDTWLDSEQIPNPQNIVLQEPGIVELKNGKLMLFCRTDTDVQYFSYSKDSGKSWSPVEPSNIKSPLSPASIERIPSTKDLLLVWNHNYNKGKDGGKRTPFNLAISKDEGKSWIKVKTLESDPNGWYCYTAIEFIDGHLLLGHCAGNIKINNGLATTQITRINLDWIYSDMTSNPFIETENGRFITLSSKDQEAEIRFTLDGSLPSKKSGKLYQDSIIVDKLTTINMQAFKEGKTSSQIISAQIGTQIFQNNLKINRELIPGLKYAYYKGKFHHTNKITQNQESVSGILPIFSIEYSPSDKYFAFIFNGYIKIPKDGTYTFHLESNDGSVLLLNDEELINNDGAHGASLKSTSTSLKSGFHKIKVKYFQLEGGKLLNLFWEGNGISNEIIPAEVLFH